MLADKSRTKLPKKTKIGGKTVHPTSNNAPLIQGHRSKVKINAQTVNVQYLPNGKAYELHTWYTDYFTLSIYADCFYLCFYYVSAIHLVNKVVCVYTDAAQRTTSATSAVTFKVKGQGRKVT